MQPRRTAAVCSGRRRKEDEVDANGEDEDCLNAFVKVELFI